MMNDYGPKVLMEGGKLPSTDASPDDQNDQYVLPPEVADLPSTLLRQYILTALHTPYDRERHTAASTGVDYLTHCRAQRPAEFLKLLHKLIPQASADQLPKPPITFRLSVPVKALDVVAEDTNHGHSHD